MEVMKKVLVGADFTLSSEIGRLGILERENAAIMNASYEVLVQELWTHLVKRC